jgi:hypothetical protein
MSEEIKVEVKPDEAIAQKTETVQQPTETVEQLNWKKFRQEREEERKAKAAAEELARKKQAENEALQRALEAVVSKPTKVMQEEEIEVSEDQKIEIKVQEALRKREMEWEKQRVEKEQKELPQRLNSNYKDFNQICTSENLDYLEYHYPEVAEPYKHMPDGYQKWEGLYKAIKRFIPVKESNKESKKAENNLSKPGALSRPGMTQSGDQAPVMMDDSRRAANWARMQKIIKGI